MSTVSRVRHSVLGKCVRQVLHSIYHLKHRNGEPVQYKLSPGVTIQLYPEGEIAEFLTLQRFFENTEMALTAAYLKPGMKVIDVGANIGVYSLLAQRRVEETGRVWAFEPSSESYRRLLRNLALNKCGCVQPVQMALSDRSDTYFTLQSDPGFGDAYRYLRPTADVSPSGGERVPVTTLDLYAARNALNNVDYMKVDVEGHEYTVFKGSQELLAASPNAVVMFESDPEWCERAGCRPQDSFELLRKLKFGLYVWDDRKRKWSGDEPSLLNATTVWASRDARALPVLT